MFETALLYIHILAGSTALLAAVIPVVTKKGGTHHVRAGRVYALAMTIVFVTALPLAILGDDIFLLIIAFFSFYLVFAGWRFARNRGRKPQLVDWVAVSIMAITGVDNVGIRCRGWNIRRFDMDRSRGVWDDCDRSQRVGLAVSPRLGCFSAPANTTAPDKHASRHYSYDHGGDGRQLRLRRTGMDCLDCSYSGYQSDYHLVEFQVGPTNLTTNMIVRIT